MCNRRINNTLEILSGGRLSDMFDFDNTDNLPPFGEAVRDAIDNGDIVGLRQALDKGGKINFRFGKYRATPIHFASKKHNLEVVEELIGRGADVNATDSIDDRPLHEAARFGSQSILLYLLENKANPNVQNEYGDCPLMYCFDTTRFRTNGWTKKAKVLLDYGATKDIKNHHGQTALDHLNNFLQRVRNGINIEKEIRNFEDLAEAFHLYDVLKEVRGKGEELLLDVIQSLKKKQNDNPGQTLTCHGQNFQDMCESALSLLRTRDWTLTWEMLEEVPSEIRQLGTVTEDMLLRSLETKHVQTKCIRLMIVGDIGVGKTTLCLNLIDENQAACPTDGINVYIQNYLVDMKTGKWKKLSKEDIHNLPTKLLSTVCREETTTGNRNIAETTTGNRNITETTTESSNIAETTTGSSNVAQTTTGNRNIAETTTGSSNIAETTTRNKNIAEIRTKTTNVAETANEKEETETEIVYERVSRDSQEQEADGSSPKVKRRKCDSEKMRNALKGVNTCGTINDDDAFLSIWDFAGDEIYEATHHIFMSPDAVYIIAFNAAACLADEKNLDKLYTWQEVIRTYSTSSAQNEASYKTPPIILVGTHLDKMGSSEDERNTNKTNLLHKMERVCSSSKLFFVNNTVKSDPAIQRIRDEIVTSAHRQKNWKKRVPATWVTLDQDLRMLKQRYLVRLSEILDIDHRNEVSIGDHEEIKHCLRYMHLTGTILFFEKEMKNVAGKEPVIVTHPQWIVDAFRCIIKAMRFVETHDDDSTKLHIIQFQKSGILTIGLLQRLWESKSRHQEILIEIMQHLDLLVAVADRPTREERRWIVPSMLRDREPTFFQEILSNPNAVPSKTLCFVFKSKVLFAIYDKLLARCLSSKLKIKKNAKGESLLQRGSACLELSRACNLLLSCEGAVVSVTLVNRNKDKDFKGKGLYVRNLLCNILQDILAQFHHTNLTYEESLHCTHKICNDECPVPISDVITEGNVPCCENFPKEQHWLNKSDTEPWMRPIKSTEGSDIEKVNGTHVSTEADFQLPTEVLDSKATSQMLAVLSTKCIGSQYIPFFMYLGLESSEIDSHKTTSDHLVSSHIAILFQKWMNKNGEQATVRKILSAMKDMDLDYEGAVKKLKPLR